LIFSGNINAQEKRKDKGHFIQYKSEFWKQIEDSCNEFSKENKKEKLTFKLDFSGIDLPQSVNEFKQYWHNPPISQGWTGTCWNFSTTSFMESEIYRLTGKKVKLSEMYNTYWEYIEKARRFVKEKGNSLFAEGSEANALVRLWKKYGCLPAEAYTGLKPNQKFHDHHKMFEEMESFLQSVKKTNTWNEDFVLETIRHILNSYLGEPPAYIKEGPRTLPPQDYLSDVLKLNPNDYVDIMSLMEKPYWAKVEYEVPDNWWHSEDYYNIPLDDFMKTLKRVVREGYTVAIGGDVTEAGIDSHAEVAMIPTFDIPPEYIDENARQFRFSNSTTTDDHGVHIVGYLEKDGVFWFLVKDSGAGSFNGPNKGYYFYHEDYIKLKMMSFMVHRDAVKDIIKKCNNKN
jgi:bleomycin hydrolase